MTLYQKFRKQKIDHAAIELGLPVMAYNYFRTP